MLRRMYGIHPATRQEIDFPLNPKLNRPNQDPLESLVARQIVLRKRRSLIGGVLFFAKKAH